MKVLLVWAVAAWVVAVTADRPCMEYCVILSSGIRDIEFQPGCDCMYEEARFENNLDDSGIYYEPADYIPLPSYIHNQPFYVLNPVMKNRQPHVPSNNRAFPENVQYLNSRPYNTETEYPRESTNSIHSRQEKDIQSKNYKLNAPLYLDVNVESGEAERSASPNTFSVEELKLTEQSLLECVKLYDVLNARKRAEMKNNQHTDEYSHIPNSELTKVIHNKCLHIAYIVEKSLKEIKETRTKIASNTFKMDSEFQQNSFGPCSNDVHNSNKHIDRSHMENTRSSQESKSTTKEYNDNEEQVVITYTESYENKHDKLHTSSSDVTSTTTTLRFAENIQSPSEIDTTTDVTKDFRKSIEQISDITSTDIENEYPLHINNTTRPTTMTSDSSKTDDVIAPSTSTVQQEFVENPSTDQESSETNVNARLDNRSIYRDGEVPLPKIITNEFSNNTLQSFINGTEDVPNRDFDDEVESIKTNNEYYVPKTTPEQFETRTNTDIENNDTFPDISGNVYFVFKNHQIPARFVQNINGSLHLGIDGTTLCDQLIQNGENKSALLTTLCKCYKSGNCIHEEGN